MTKIKICGLSRLVDIEMVNEALPDYIGFVFAKSKRQVTEDTARQLKEKLNPNIQTVGVFVNEDIERMKRICYSGIIDIIQLHGDEDESYIKELKMVVNNKVIKAVRVRKRENIKAAEHLPCDYLLLDAYREDQYGGSGEAFDWTSIKEVNKPFFLAGGINAGNVCKAIELVKPYSIDVSSGVETDGYKDKNKIIEIITKVRNVGRL